MSQAKSIIAVLVIVFFVGISVWVNSLQSRLTAANRQVEELRSVNAELLSSVKDKTQQIKAERDASAARSSTIKALNKELKSRSEAYESSTKTELCASATVPSDVIKLLQ